MLIEMHFAFGAEVMMAVASAGGMAQQAAAGPQEQPQDKSKTGPSRPQAARPLAKAA